CVSSLLLNPPPPLLLPDAPPPATHPLSLHDALPIWRSRNRPAKRPALILPLGSARALPISSRKLLFLTCSKSNPTNSRRPRAMRSEEHTSELQSLAYLVCRLLLEKKKHSRTSALLML